MTEGSLPDAPDIQFYKDGPAGTLRLTTADGGLVVAENHRGLYVDVETGQAIGRDLGVQLYLDLDAVRDALEDDAPEGEGVKPKAGTGTDEDEPKLCPAPTEDTPHYATEPALAYEDDLDARVNPLAPLPRGFGVKVFNPVTGEYVFFDDCFRYAGDLVDGDMQAGDLVEAKGPTKDFLYGRGWSIDEDVEQAEKELEAADARGVGLKWYYAEPGAAIEARKRFDDAGLKDIVIGVMPPRRRR